MLQLLLRGQVVLQPILWRVWFAWVICRSFGKKRLLNQKETFGENANTVESPRSRWVVQNKGEM